ncbi:MAG: LamG domain-containing protein, partial [Victivallales bacterium]|nr:LamG domain-containing protein [Victivallales bacterium]
MWDFDGGRNIDTEAGVTEFTRTKSLSYEGVTAAGKDKVQLSVSAAADPARVFADSFRKIAFRTGIDSKTGHQFFATGRLAAPLSKVTGAVALWLCPEDWSGEQRGPFRIFFAANDKENRTNELLIYKNGMSNQIMFLIGNNDSKHWSWIGRSIWDWKKGEWHFVCASWSRDVLYLYIDGKLQDAQRKALPDADYNILHIGSRDWKNEGGLTLIDDLAIYDKTLSLAEMDAIYRKTRPLKNDRAAPITYHLGIATPKLDGKIEEFEYSAVSNGTFNIKTMVMDSSCRWAFARDSGKLYFASETAAPRRKDIALTRDGNLWEDESVEFHLTCNGKRWQFIFNSSGAMFDSCMNDHNWNVRNIEQKHSVVNSRWLMECAISFADLGISPQEGDRLYATICRGGNNSALLAASPLVRQFLDQANFIKLIFDNDAKPFAVDFRELPGSEGKLDMRISTQKGAKGALRFDGMDARNRKLAGTTVPFADSENASFAAVKTSAMAREGIIAYEVALDGKDMTSAKLPYLSTDKVKVCYLRTHINEQMLETVISIMSPVASGSVFEQMLKDKKGKVVLQQRTVADEGNAMQSRSLSWDISTLPPGDYDYYFNLVENDNVKTMHHQYFMKPEKTMPWHGFAGGVSDKVPAPWHAPNASGAVLSCLMQSFDFTSSLLPRDIIAEGRSVVSRPLALRINGKEHALTGKFELLSQNAQSIKFQSAAIADDIAFAVNGVLEYDGFCRLALSYAPLKTEGNTALQELSLLIHMTPAQSALFYDYEPGEDVERSGKTPAALAKNFFEHPCFWIGDAERGLFIGADSMRGTHVRDTSDSLRVSRDANGAVMTLKLVDSPFALSTSRTVEFFVQPTPTKPVPNKFTRPFMYRGGVNSYRIRTNYSKVFNSYQRRFNDMDAMKRIFSSPPAHYVQGIYNAIYGISPFTPEWPYYVEKWISSPPGPGQYKLDYPLNDEAARNHGMWAFACVNCRDYMEWHLYYINDLVQDKEIGLKDMYFDMAYPRACDNTFHGCGWRDDFCVLRKTYPILANREFTKRIAKILKDKNPDAVLMYHPSGEPIPPLYSLVDVCVDGERFVSRVSREESYYSIFTPELMQSNFNGVQNGTVNVYISQLARSASFFNPARREYWLKKEKAPEAVRAVRHFLGYCLLHNIHPHAGACIYNEGEALEKQLYSLGWDDGKIIFFPYWRDGCPVRTTAKNVLVSAFKLPKGMLAVVLNDDKSQEASV